LQSSLAIFYVEGVGISLVGAVGCLINLAAIWRLNFGQGRRKRHTFHYLLISLSVYDLVEISDTQFKSKDQFLIAEYVCMYVKGEI
jgi:hypothetical protein